MVSLGYRIINSRTNFDSDTGWQRDEKQKYQLCYFPIADSVAWTINVIYMWIQSSVSNVMSISIYFYHIRVSIRNLWDIKIAVIEARLGALHEKLDRLMNLSGDTSRTIIRLVPCSNIYFISIMFYWPTRSVSRESVF